MPTPRMEQSVGDEKEQPVFVDEDTMHIVQEESFVSHEYFENRTGLRFETCLARMYWASEGPKAQPHVLLDSAILRYQSNLNPTHARFMKDRKIINRHTRCPRELLPAMELILKIASGDIFMRRDDYTRFIIAMATVCMGMKHNERFKTAQRGNERVDEVLLLTEGDGYEELNEDCRKAAIRIFSTQRTQQASEILEILQTDGADCIENMYLLSMAGDNFLMSQGNESVYMPKEIIRSTFCDKDGLGHLLFTHLAEVLTVCKMDEELWKEMLTVHLPEGRIFKIHRFMHFEFVVTQQMPVDDDFRHTVAITQETFGLSGKLNEEKEWNDLCQKNPAFRAAFAAFIAMSSLPVERDLYQISDIIFKETDEFVQPITRFCQMIFAKTDVDSILHFDWQDAQKPCYMIRSNWNALSFFKEQWLVAPSHKTVFGTAAEYIGRVVGRQIEDERRQAHGFQPANPNSVQHGFEGVGTDEQKEQERIRSAEIVDRENQLKRAIDEPGSAVEKERQLRKAKEDIEESSNLPLVLGAACLLALVYFGTR